MVSIEEIMVALAIVCKAFAKEYKNLPKEKQRLVIRFIQDVLWGEQNE